MTLAEAELLEESAALARRIAPMLCRVDPETGERCAWNHGFWQILRLLGLNANPSDQAALYRNAMRNLGDATRVPRVLVSGSADYGMLHQVMAAFAQSEARPEVTVVDICETPLALNRWYAERAGVQISTVCCDILDYAEREPFDAICTHAFLAQFPREVRERLIDAWRRLLRPGGIAVTVNRVRPTAGTERVSFAETQARALSDTVATLAASLPPSLALDASVLAREAEDYARRQRPYPVHSEEEIRTLFESGGFAIDRLSCAPVDGAGRHAVRGPTVSAGALYASIIARRR